MQKKIMESLRIGDILYMYDFVMDEPIKTHLITKIDINPREKTYVFEFQEQILPGCTTLPLYRYELSRTTIVIGSTIFSSNKEDVLTVKGRMAATKNYQRRKPH